MKRRILATVLAISIMCVGGCSKQEEKKEQQNQEKVVETETKQEEQSKVEDFVKYNDLEDGTISIKFFDIDAPLKNVIIPEEIDGKKVTELNDGVFKIHNNIEKMSLPKTLRRIRREAFHLAESLEEVEINGPVETLEYQVFYGCSSLKKLEFPEGLKTVEKMAISNCENLTDIYLPSTVESIDPYNFGMCADPLKIHVPAGSTTEKLVRDIVSDSSLSDYNIEVIAE